MDYLRSITGNQYLIIEDAYSKWIEAFRVP